MSITNISVDGKKYPDGPAGLVHVFIDQLKSYRRTTPHPEELEWEIRVYQYILAQADVDAAFRAYGAARHPEGAFRSKRQAVEALGWKIPEAQTGEVSRD